MKPKKTFPPAPHFGGKTPHFCEQKKRIKMKKVVKNVEKMCKKHIKVSF